MTRHQATENHLKPINMQNPILVSVRNNKIRENNKYGMVSALEQQRIPIVHPQNHIILFLNVVDLPPSYSPYNMSNGLVSLKYNINFLNVLQAQKQQHYLNDTLIVSILLVVNNMTTITLNANPTNFEEIIHKEVNLEAMT